MYTLNQLIKADWFPVNSYPTLRKLIREGKLVSDGHYSPRITEASVNQFTQYHNALMANSHELQAVREIIPTNKIYKLIEEGVLDKVRHCGRAYITKESLKNYLAKLKNHLKFIS